MRLPDELAAAIRREVEPLGGRDLLRASQELTRRYKSANFAAPAIKSDLDRAAYLLARLPATYAAASRVFNEVRRRAPHCELTSLLDLGAGPGTSLFAAAEIFPLQRAQLVELSDSWVALGQRLTANISSLRSAQTQWLRYDLSIEFESPPHDLVVISYSLGELATSAARALVNRAWRWASKFVAVIEPGTPRGCATILAARSALIAEGATILAPCPHAGSCPMVGTSDWCHFSQRVERSSQHRRLKSGALGYEDEKFSYVIAAKAGGQPAAARIVRHPKKLGGHVQLSLCTLQGLTTQTITRSMGAEYKSARQAEWGDAWETSA